MLNRFVFTTGLIIYGLNAYAQSILVDSIYHENQYRYFGIYLPAGYTGTTSWPVVLTLHGGGGDAIGTIGFTQMNNVADTAHFLVVYPQGTPNGSECCSWAAGIGSPADLNGVDDVLFFDKLLDKLNTLVNVDSTKVYATGLSQGGYMSQRLACQLSHRIAAVAPLCSNLDSLQMLTCNPVQAVPVMVINGTSDLLVPYNGASFSNNGWHLTYFPTDSLMAFWRDKNGCNALPVIEMLPDIVPSEQSTITKFTWQNCRCNTQIILYRVNGGGHTWPGVVSPFYELFAGQTNEDVHASVDIWNFFKNYTLGCNTTETKNIRPFGKLQAFPNPATNRITIYNQSFFSKKAQVWNALGQVIEEISLPSDNSIILDMSSLPAGLYYLSDGQQTIKIAKY